MSRPTIAEIAALTERLRELSRAGRDADQAEVDRFLADKHQLIDRITAASSHADPRPPMRGRDNVRTAFAADEALTEVAQARADRGGYALVGPSARTWRTEPDTGRPIEPVPDAEHKAVRELLGREAVATTDPEWADGPDGNDMVSKVIPAQHEVDDTFLGVADAHAQVRHYLDGVTYDKGESAHDLGIHETSAQDAADADQAGLW